MTQAGLTGFLLSSKHFHRNQAHVQTIGDHPHALFKIISMSISKVHHIEQHIDLKTLDGLGKPFPDAILGLTVVAIGTSLPELAATMIAAWRGHTDVAVANIIGSNIFNILGILGASSLAGHLPFSAEIRHYDIWVLLASTMILFPILITDWRISRREGAILLTCYGAYIASLVWRMFQYGGAAAS